MVTTSHLPPYINVVELPRGDMRDVAAQLRRLADRIEEGEFGDAHNLVWVIDCGAGRVELGLMGLSPTPGANGHFLLALGMRRLEHAGLGLTP